MPIDYSKYPDNWKSEIVPRIIQRAGNKCEICGIENGAQAYSIPLRILDGKRYKVKRFWITNQSDIQRMTAFTDVAEGKWITVVLTIAHLDHDETNHNVTDDRLKAMCQYCHLNYDSSEKYRRALSK